MPPVRGSVPVTSFTRTAGLTYAPAHSCPDKEGHPSSGWRQDENKIQDQVLALSLHIVTR